MMGVERGITRPIGLPIRNRRYNGGSSHERAGLGMSSSYKSDTDKLDEI